jgi:hypothetical protein
MTAGQEGRCWRVVLDEGEYISPPGSKWRVHESGALFMLDPSGKHVRAVFSPTTWRALWPEGAS